MDGTAIYIESVKLKRTPEEGYLSSLSFIPFLQKERLVFDRDVTFFTGENGIGKSTLLEAIAVAAGFNPEGGSKNFRFSTKDSHSSLYQYLTLSRIHYFHDGFFFRAESFYNASTYVDEMDKIAPLLCYYGGKSLHHLSHGESFLTLLESRFSGKGLYLFDEPEAALSLTGLLRFMIGMRRLVKSRAQLIISTHSPVLLTYPDARIYELRKDGPVSVSYQETAAFSLTKRFLNQPEQMLSYLFSDEEKESEESGDSSF